MRRFLIWLLAGLAIYEHAVAHNTLGAIYFILFAIYGLLWERGND